MKTIKRRNFTKTSGLRYVCKVVLLREKNTTLYFFIPEKKNKFFAIPIIQGMTFIQHQDKQKLLDR